MAFLNLAKKYSAIRNLQTLTRNNGLASHLFDYHQPLQNPLDKALSTASMDAHQLLVIHMIAYSHLAKALLCSSIFLYRR